MNDRGYGSSGGYSSQQSGGYNGKNIDTNDVLVNRNEMKMKNMNDSMDDDFNFGSDNKNFNYTSNISSNENNGFGNSAPYSGAGAAVVGAAAIGGMAAMNNSKDSLKPQMVNMTNIEPPESQEPNQTPIIKVDEEPKAQMVNMTNIKPPESQEQKTPSMIIKPDDEPKAQMVNMTEIPEPEQLNRNTKFLSSYSEAPSNQRISSQFYGESEVSYEFSNNKLNIPSQIENQNISMTSSALFSNRSSTDKELNSTPYIAVHVYEPQLNDELLLDVNDIVEVVYVYDDGWVWGINTRTGESGACPMLCLEKIEGDIEDFSVDDRIKSMTSARDSMISRDSIPGRRDSRILKIDGINK